MPELPDVLCDVDALNDTVAGHEIVGVSLRDPFVVRTPEPLDQVVGRTVGPFRRLGKRTVWPLEDDMFLVAHTLWLLADTTGRGSTLSLPERPICSRSTSRMARS